MVYSTLECFVNGNQLCIIRSLDFVNLQESPVIFIPLNEERIKHMQKLREGKLR